jgi:hypothetical protein
MVKKQQMRWTPRGAHLLLQVRTRVLNNDLADDFHRWYPASPTPRQRTHWIINWWPQRSFHGLPRSPSRPPRNHKSLLDI